MTTDSAGPRLSTRLIAALGTTAACTAFLFVFSGFPKVDDERAALAISRYVADPGLYPSTDLIVTSGLRAPYFAYRAASVLYANGLSVDFWWLAVFLLVTVSCLLLAWAIAERFTRDLVVASVATAVLAVASPYRGSIHWFFFPPPNLVVAPLVTPVALAALLLSLRGRHGLALLIAALSFNVHPSLGLITASTIAIRMLIDVRAIGWRPLAGWFAAAILCALPTVWFVLHSTPSNFAAAAGSIHEQFNLYAVHVRPADHWRENYGWFLLQLAAFIVLCPRRGVWRDTAILAGWMLALMVVYVGNLYTFDYMGLNLALLFRGAALVKVLFWCALTPLLVRQAVTAAPAARRAWIAALATLLVGALHKNLDIGEGLAAIAGALMLVADRLGAPAPGAPRIGAGRFALAALLTATGLIEVLAQGWSVFHVTRFSASNIDVVRLSVIWTAALLVLAACWWRALMPEGGLRPANDAAPAARPARALLAVVGVLCLTVALRGNVRAMRPAGLATIAKRARIADPPDATRGVIAWAGTTPRGSLFAVPPDISGFAWLRVTAGRGVYITLNDVNQLSYDQSVYAEGHRRMLALGTVVLGRQRFDTHAYDTLGADSVAALARDGVDFAIFPREARTTRPLPFPVAYADSLWTVFDLRALR